MPKNTSAFGEVAISPLSGQFDLRSPSGRLDPADFRLVLNASMNEQGKRCRRPGWKKLFADSPNGFNNQDLHDQLIDLQYYYNYEEYPYTFYGGQTGSTYTDFTTGTPAEGYMAGWFGDQIYYCDDGYCCPCPDGPSLDAQCNCGTILLEIDTGLIGGHPYTLTRNGVEIASGNTPNGALSIVDTPPNLYLIQEYELSVDMGWPCGVITATDSAVACCNDGDSVFILTPEPACVGDPVSIQFNSSLSCTDTVSVLVDGVFYGSYGANNTFQISLSFSTPGIHTICITASDLCYDFSDCGEVLIEPCLPPPTCEPELYNDTYSLSFIPDDPNLFCGGSDRDPEVTSSVLTRGNPLSCTWEGVIKGKIGGVGDDVYYGVSMFLGAGIWNLQVTGSNSGGPVVEVFIGEKTTGETPSGNYGQTGGCSTLGAMTIT